MMTVNELLNALTQAKALGCGEAEVCLQLSGPNVLPLRMAEIKELTLWKASSGPVAGLIVRAEETTRDKKLNS